MFCPHCGQSSVKRGAFCAACGFQMNMVRIAGDGGRRYGRGDGAAQLSPGRRDPAGLMLI